jgi:PAS domain S-box-containing protein
MQSQQINYRRRFDNPLIFDFMQKPCANLWYLLALPSRAYGLLVMGVLGAVQTSAHAAEPASASSDMSNVGPVLTLSAITAVLIIILLSRQLTIRRLRHDLDTMDGERRRIQLEIQRFTAVMNQASEAIMITDADQRIMYINPGFTKLLGYTRRDVYNETPKLFSTDRYDETFYANMHKKLTTDHIWRGWLTDRTKDGGDIELDTTITAVLDESGNISSYVFAARDITHEHELEMQLTHAQKMEVLGTLAGGIAHDFNNILSAIIGYTELGLMDAPEGTPIEAHFNQVLKAAKRAADLVSQILTFSRRNVSDRQPLLLGPIIDEALKMLRGTLPKTIDIRSRLEPDVPPVMAETAQMHQIIMNLCTNASHAMRESGGILEAGLKTVVIDGQRESWQSGLASGTYAELTIRDTGHGMRPETIDHIFEPYFTTKEDGDGTGLGLATVHGIVSLHEGAIHVDSTPDKGTTFTILLPVCRAEAVVPEAHEVSELPLPGNNARIMVVDDEESLAKMIEAALSWLGYKPTAFTSSVKALEAFEATPDAYDAVITDQTMPTLPGAELAKRVLKIRPDIPVILCSGYSEAIDSARAKQLGIREYLMKPITGRGLAAVLQKYLVKKSDATA